MKKIIITFHFLVATTILANAQTTTTLHTTSTNVSTTINQPNIGTLIKQLNNGFEVRKMRLPFTSSEAEYTVQKRGHEYILDGDIVVGDDLPKTQSFTLDKGSLNNKWPNTTIPVFIDASIYFNSMENAVFDAIDEMNNKLGLTVQLRTNENDYVNIVGKGSDILNGAGGDSKLGRQGGEQLLRLLVGNFDHRAILLHEILHAAGVYHEMGRPDRDNYIQINWANIDDDHKSQYDPHFDGSATGDFDYCSIMLYSRKGFAIDKSNTTWDPKKPMPSCINKETNTYSDLDINGLSSFYGISQRPSQLKIPRGSGEHFAMNGITIISENKKYKLTYENDGTIKTRRVKDNFLLWSSPTVGKANGVGIMQADGNFVMYGPAGEVYWATNTTNNWGSKLVVQNNGNLTIINQLSKQTWASNAVDNPVEKIQLQNGYSISGTIKWTPDIGMPISGNVADWFTIKSYGPTAFEANNVDKEIYNPNGFVGRYLDYKNIGTITFEPIVKVGNFYQVNFKVKDLPLWIPYTFDVNVNQNISWAGQSSKPLPPFQTAPYIVTTGQISQLKWGKFTTAIPYEDVVSVDLTGAWSRKATANSQIDPKISQPNPGGPVASPVIKSTPVIIKSVIKQ